MAAQPPAAVPHRIQRSLSAPWRWYYSWVLKTVFPITILITVDRTDLAEKSAPSRASACVRSSTGFNSSSNRAILRKGETDVTQTTEHCYVVKDDQILSGEPTIKGTRTPVRAIIETWRLGTTPEEIPKHLPHLTLAQVFDALSYYSDHQDEINSHIERNRIPDELIDPLVQDQ